MSQHFFFVLSLKRQTKVREKHPCVLYTSFNGVLLKSSFWSPVWGSWRIYLLFFLSILWQKIRKFQPDRETSVLENLSFFLLSPTQRDVCNNARKCTSSTLNSAVSTSVRSVRAVKFTLCAKPMRVTLSRVNPLFSKQSFTLTAKPESPLLMFLLIVMGRS